MANETERYEDLIAHAQGADAEHPRLILELLSEDTSAAERLAIIGKLNSEDPDDSAQIAAQRALAELQTPDIAAAHVSLKEVEALKTCIGRKASAGSPPLASVE